MEKNYSKEPETKKLKITTKDDDDDNNNNNTLPKEKEETEPKEDKAEEQMRCCESCKKSPQDTSSHDNAPTRTDSSVCLLPYQACPHCHVVSYLKPDPNYAEKGEFGYILTDLCFESDWDRALQRVKIYPKEAGLIQDSYKAESALHWAAYNNAPKEVLTELARADPKQIGRGCSWGADGANPLMLLLFKSYKSSEDEIDILKDLIAMNPKNVLELDGECGNACLLDYAWMFVEKKVSKELEKGADIIELDKLDHDFLLQWELFSFMVQQAFSGQSESLITAFACMDNSLCHGDVPPRGPPVDALRFAILVAGEDEAKKQLLQSNDEGGLLLHKIAAGTKRPSRKWELEEMYWQEEDELYELKSEDEYLDWEEGQYKAKHLVVLLRTCPETAKIPNEKGQLALHVAIDVGRSWHKGGVKEIFEAYPDAAKVPYKGMLPFLQAAATSQTTFEEDIELAIEKASEWISCYDDLFDEEYNTDDYDSDGELKEDILSKHKPPREDWTHWKDDHFDLTYELLRAWPEALMHFRRLVWSEL